MILLSTHNSDFLFSEVGFVLYLQNKDPDQMEIESQPSYSRGNYFIIKENASRYTKCDIPEFL